MYPFLALSVFVMYVNLEINIIIIIISYSNMNPNMKSPWIKRGGYISIPLMDSDLENSITYGLHSKL